MPVGVLIQHGRLEKALSSLDIDEGTRIESPKKNEGMFINRSLSGSFVVQVGEEEFYYFYSAAQVIRLAERIFGKRYSAWKY